MRGSPDPITGYVADIGAIDRFVRAVALPRLADHSRRGAPIDILRTLIGEAPRHLGQAAHAITLRLTPFHSITMRSPRPSDAAHDSSAVTSRVLVRQQFDFAASHRLHCPTLDARRNLELFGKCNNPNGHGHNYRLDVAVEATVTSDGLVQPRLDEIDAAARRAVVDRFDHKHLNVDVPEFSALNPSVENIARTAFELLAPEILGAGGVLRSVTVWETEKTRCTYPIVADDQ